MKPISICAVVATFNRKAVLTKCLTALLSQSRSLDEIVLIDNASTDGTGEFIKAEFSRVTYVKLSENIGSAGGFGEGLKLAYEKGHDWIWVMDNDAVPLADALEKLASSPAMLLDNVYAVASTVMDGDGRILHWHRNLFDSRTLKETPVDAARYKDEYFEVDTAGWTGLLVSCRTIKDVGLPLKDLFIYFDDCEYSLRMRQKGIILTVPASKVLHSPGSLNPGTGKPIRWLRPSRWRQYYVTRNRIYTYRKYARPGLFFERLPFYTMIGLGLAYGVLQTLVFREYRFQSLRIRLRGTWDGLRGKVGKNNNFLPG
jgi:rhamnopyranosyl-N-acetylglucosaminyl-diphospho-decaprenol beta-1,3/1,4-galactofuranosyltransferase